MSVKISDYPSVKDPSKYEGIAKTFDMTSSYGFEADIITYGALIRSLKVPSPKTGETVDIMLGLKGLDEYMADGSNHGSVVGRSANRISGASFEIAGVKYSIPANDGPNNLHSGNPAYQNVFWEGSVLSKDDTDKMIADSGIAGIAEADGESVLLKYTSPDGACGFPGNLKTEVLYAWLADKTLLILYMGESDKATVFAPTNHSYFNLGGHDAGYVGDELIMINADQITLKDEFNCPDGRISDVEGTDFDVREYSFMSQLIESDEPQITMSSGIDQNFILKNPEGTFSFAASLTDPKTGITMETLTDLPGIQIYAGNHLGGDMQKGDKPYKPYDAVCLEAQMFPNAVNIPDFKSPIIPAGEKIYHACGYRFIE